MFKKIISASSILTLLIAGCSKSGGSNDTMPTTMVMPPTVSSATFSAITQTTATFGGNVTAENNGTVTAKGTCWSTTAGPTTANSKTNDGSGLGAYVSNLTGLTPATTYFARAYATNSSGTNYGTELSFTTLATVGVSIPSLSTVAISAVTQTTAASGGSISSDGGGPVTARGVVWAVSANPTIANSASVDGTGTGAYTSSITGLTANTLYHVRAYATNSAGTAYGNDLSFTSLSAGGGPATINVSIAGLAFSPATLTAHVGDIIRWTNNDGTPHTVTADLGAFSSPTLNNGGIFSYTTTFAGTINYHCTIHPSMTATITVIP